MKEDVNEEWRDVVGYEGLYGVSNLGRIFSVKSDRCLKLGKNNRGFTHTNLVKDGKTKLHMVHRLVAEAFVPNPKNYSEVKMIKGKSILRADCLKWVRCSKDKTMDKDDLIKYYDELDKSKWKPYQLTLLEFVKTGDSKHLNSFFQKYYPKFMAWLAARTQNEDLAFDIIQSSYEDFTIALNTGRFRIEDCRVQYAGFTYMKRILYYKFCDHVKRDEIELEGKDFLTTRNDDYNGYEY